MSLLIYAESADGKFKKVAFELASYAKKVAESLGTTVTAVIVNSGSVSDLSKYGVDKVLKVTNDKLKNFNAKAYADVVKQAAQKESAKVILLSSTTDSLYMAPIVAIGLDAGFASNVVGLPLSTSPFQVKRNAFSNKAFNITEISTDVKVLSLAKNPILAFFAIDMPPSLMLTSSPPVPVIARRRVDLPAPFRPTKAHLSFGRIVQFTSLITSLLPIDRRTLLISTAAPLDPLNVTPVDCLGALGVVVSVVLMASLHLLEATDLKHVT